MTNSTDIASFLKDGRHAGRAGRQGGQERMQVICLGTQLRQHHNTCIEYPDEATGADSKYMQVQTRGDGRDTLGEYPKKLVAAVDLDSILECYKNAIRML
jgi:hypothetical protein